MYLCLCNNIREADVRQALDSGQCRNYRDVSRQLNVGRQCGKCACDAKKLVQNHQAEQRLLDDLSYAVS